MTRARALSAGKATGPKLPADAPYVAFSLRPKLPRWVQGQRRAFVLALDTSRSMYGEHFQRASEVVQRIVREMDSEDRVTVLACDTTCRAIPGGFMQPGPAAETAVRGFLEGLTPEGASDLVNTLVEASALKRELGDRALRIVYVGDGTPTVGSVLPSFISRELKQRLPAGTTVHAVSVGADADLGAIEAATEAGGGVVVPYAPGRSAASVAFAVLGAAYGNSLEDVSLELPPGLVEVAPQRLGSIASGSEALVVARMLTPRLSGKVRLRGKLGGQNYEQSYPLELEATGGAGNAFVPRLFAAARIAELGKSPLAEAREESVELSRAFSVASRYTSLLVLESPAMFEAFGLDATRAAPEWSGEDSIAESEADGEVRYQAGPSPAPAPAKPSARAAEPLAGLGSGAGRKASANDALMDDSFGDEKPRPFDRARRWVPMRRVWDRSARIHPGDQPLKGGSPEAVARAQASVEQNPQSRAARKELYVAQFLAGRLAEAQATAERWSEQDPLDPDALTARADVAAQRGDRKLAMRLLDSVIDVRPDDYKAQWRLARLHRWRGQALQGCRYSLAVAQMHPSDLERVSAALRCTQSTGDAASFEDLRSMAPAALRAKLDQALAKRPADDLISGDFRLEASWEGGAAEDADDIDLVIVHPDGFRVSWLGAPTRAVISARDVLSTRHEALGLSGAKAGSYAIELVRNAAAEGTLRGTVTGDLKLTVGNQVRSLPFKLEGSRVRVATVDLSFTSRLVPID
jgi:tetratricopeptide (TPR) repeat protein